MTVPSNLVPTKITDLPVAPNPTSSATMVCVIQGVTYQVPFIDLQSTVSVPATRLISTGGGLQGGGDLSQDRTLSIATGGVTNAMLANNAVTAGTYGSGTLIPVVTVDSKGLVTSVSTTALVISGYVPDTRQIIAGTGLSGGGNLQADRTINMVFSTTTPTALGTATIGTQNNAAQGDHVHPALNFANLTEYTGLLPLTNGGTGTQVNSLTAGAVWYNDGSNGFLQTVQGSSGQVLVSNGAAAPGWGSALVVAPQPANYVYAGPTSGPSATTTFRLLVNDDIPSTLTSKSMSGASNTFSNIPNAALTNSAVTINGTPVSLGGSITVTATSTAALTIGTGLSGTSYNGSTAVTIAIDSTVATLTGSQTLTNKTISGSSNTLTNIANASLTNSLVTVGTTAIALGASSLTLGGLTTVTVTQDPTSALQLATKQYVDAVAQGLDPKASCVAATTANITLSGTQTIDGVALIAGDRCLVKDQTLSQNNGIYLVAAGAWTRATDMDNWLEVPGAFTFIEQGTLYADTGWVCTSNAGGTLGTTAITWVQFAGVGSYTAGTGLTLTGTQFSLTTPVAIALGGTNATTATNARTNLVAAKSGTNSDITELYALNGTSYGVAYQNAGNQLIMGSVLTFNGTTLTAPDAAFATLTASSTITLSGLTASTALALNASKQVVSVTNTGTGNNVLATSPTLQTPALGTPTSGTLTSCTGLSLTTGVTGTLPIANGGTNSTVTPTAGAIPYGNGTKYSFSSAGTSGDFLISGGTGSPTWTNSISGGTYA